MTGVVTVGVADCDREGINEGGEVDDASQEPWATFVNGWLSGLELKHISEYLDERTSMMY